MLALATTAFVSCLIALMTSWQAMGAHLQPVCAALEAAV